MCAYLSESSLYKHLPVHDVGQQIIMFDFIVLGNLLVIHRQLASLQAACVFFWRSSTEFTNEDIENLLVNPAPFGECCEGEKIGIHLSKS